MTRLTPPDAGDAPSTVPPAWLPSAPRPPFNAVGPQPRRGAAGPQALTPIAHQWIARVPPRYQPLATARRYPHVVNRLAALWDDPREVAAYLQDLLLPSRPGRMGFSFDVLTELSDLQDLVGLRPARP